MYDHTDMTSFLFREYPVLGVFPQNDYKLRHQTKECLGLPLAFIDIKVQRQYLVALVRRLVVIRQLQPWRVYVLAMAKREDWDKVRYLERYIIQEIDPIKLLTILRDVDILNQRDCEFITAADRNHGATHATQRELLVRLKKRGPHAFSHFVVALREAGLSHVAQLLDPKFKVTASIPNGTKDERVLAAGVSADIRVKIILFEPTDEQIKEVQGFCERYKICHSEGVIELRQHFSDLLDEDIRQHVNLVKTTSSKENPLIFIFRMSHFDVANTFWKNFNDGDLKSKIKTKLQGFSNNNCFKNEDIHFDIEIDPDDFQKVCHTLENPEDCKVLVDGMEKQELKLRNYQLDLVKPALEGKNTLICAPTGSGKTFVAMEAIKHHVASRDRKYVAFIVHRVCLVEQQESCLGRYLPESVVVSSVCGSNSDTSLPSILEGTDVVVLTAQVLLNSLKGDKHASDEGAAGKKELSISQFSLLVFDECHNTTKEHPYNEIMRWYMKEMFEISPSNLPQIIGLSASLGIGTGNSGCGQRAEEYIIGLCANLDVYELQVYGEQQCTSTKITSISRDHISVFQKTISGVMTEIETIMSTVDKPSHSHGSQPYENWVVNQCKEDLGRDILTCLEHLNFYNSSLMINDEIRSEDALRYLLENIHFHPKDSIEIEMKLQEVFNNSVAAIQNGDSEPNPGLVRLEESLLEKLSFRAENGHLSKGIIFVKTRVVAEALVNWLENSQTLRGLVKNPTSVVGCGQRNGKVGMPKARQTLEIKNFRDGDCNVIVATSVLLEGIDIPKCNFVINYGMPGNEITFMQARGRVRTNDPVDWQYDIIVPREQVMSKERDLRKEKLMKETIEKVNRMSKEEFVKKVKNLQKKAYKEYLVSLSKRGSTCASPVPDDVHFHCQRCGVFACKAQHIKLVSDTCHVVPNYEKNLHNFLFEDSSVSKKSNFKDFSKTGIVNCSSCKQHWGSRARNEFGEFPVIKLSSFRVKISGKSNFYSKWKDFPYVLETFDPENDVGSEQAAEDDVEK